MLEIAVVVVVVVLRQKVCQQQQQQQWEGCQRERGTWFLRK